MMSEFFGGLDKHLINLRKEVTSAQRLAAKLLSCLFLSAMLNIFLFALYLWELFN